MNDSTSKRSAEEIVREFPDWMQSALVPPRDEAASSDNLRQHPEWPSLLRASVVSSFLPEELDLGGESLEVGNQTLLKSAELVSDSEGYRWALRPDARTQILNTASPEEIAEALRRTSEFQDPLSQALRQFLKPNAPREAHLAERSLPELEAAHLAMSWLADVETVGDAEQHRADARRLSAEIRLRRLLAPFRRAVGDDGPGTVVGRGDEIEQLRAYVGEIAADSLAKSTSRGLKWLGRTVSRQGTTRAPLNVWGRGGIGKTTLISLFMLEHARAAQGEFPFVYLDFDRSSLSPQDAPSLLLEMSQQIAAQFSDLAPELESLEARIRRAPKGPEWRSPSGPIIGAFTQDLREIIDGFLEKRDSFFGRKPFLVVFDTFEAVQHSEADFSALEGLMWAFSRDGTHVWPRLRLIISGRNVVPTFIGDHTERLPLKGLRRKDATSFLVTLLREMGRDVAHPSELRTLIRAISRLTGTDRISPLWIHYIARDLSSGPPNAIAQLRAEIEREAADADGEPSEVLLALIQGVFVRRTLGHIRDQRVRALSDPGLVVRRITPDVIRHIMVPCTPNPNTGDTWNISDEEAHAIYDAFSREHSLVRPDGDALRHHSDVRRDMLPLIRSRSREAFDRIHRTAFDYFWTRAEADPGDLYAAEEAIYHGLWVGLPISTLDALWRDNSAFAPRIDPSGFPEDSVAAHYIRFRQAPGQWRPRWSSVRKLPSDLVLEWLQTHSANLLKNDDATEARTILQFVAGESYERIEVEAAPAVARSLYRAGAWQEARDLIARHVRSVPIPATSPVSKSELGDRFPAVISLLRTWATLIGKAGAPTSEDRSRVIEYAQSIGDPLIRAEVLAHCRLGQSDAHDEGTRPLDGRIASALEGVDQARWISEPRIHRLSLFVAAADRRERVARYLSNTRNLLSVPATAEDVDRVLNLAFPSRMVPPWPSEEAWEERARIWTEEMDVIVSALRQHEMLLSPVLRIIAHDHGDWVRPLQHAWSALPARERKEIRETFARDEDGRRTLSESQRRSLNSRRSDRAWLQDVYQFGLLLTLAERATDGATQGWTETSYPSSFQDLARALLGWHRSLLRQIAGTRS